MSKRAQDPLYAMVDANFAAPKSRTCFVIMRAGCGVIMRSTKQKIVALSTAEAEYYAATTCVQMVLWARGLLQEIGWKDDQATRIQIDNTSTIRMAQRIGSHRRTLHLAVRDEFLHQHVESKEIDPQHIATNLNASDIGTKPLEKKIFEKHRSNIFGETLTQQFSWSKPLK